jgi:hypothetical protein
VASDALKVGHNTALDALRGDQAGHIAHDAADGAAHLISEHHRGKLVAIDGLGAGG